MTTDPTLNPFITPPYSLESIDFDIEDKIRLEQYKQTRLAIDRITDKYAIHNDLCKLEDVARILTQRGSQVVSHTETSISDHLIVKIGQHEFNVEKPLFPNRINPIINISVNALQIKESIPGEYSAHSIANILEDISDWIPEYISIAERVTIQEMKIRMACEMALDILKRIIEPILSEKGYCYSIIPFERENKASIRINPIGPVNITLHVDLLEDFLEEVRSFVESLPPKNKTIG